jgi:hypothetical protein
LSRNHAIDLIVRIVHPPETEAERDRQEAFAKGFLPRLELLARGDLRKAATDAIRGYLESDPDALRRWAAGEPLPSKALEPLDDPTLTPAQEQKLRKELVDASEKSRDEGR